MITTITEILYLVITVFVVGYIFSGVIKHPFKKQDEDAIFNRYKFFDWEDIKWGIIVAAPAVILHELAHRIAGVAFGLTTYYEIWITGMLIGIGLRAVNSGFMFLAPGYVVILGSATPLQASLTAFAGPFVNLILWLGSYFILKYSKNISHKTQLILIMTQQINKWLFIFNMIPLPPLDGFNTIEPLLHIFGI
jgi:Zn-dependent protease